MGFLAILAIAYSLEYEGENIIYKVFVCIIAESVKRANANADVLRSPCVVKEAGKYSMQPEVHA